MTDAVLPAQDSDGLVVSSLGANLLENFKTFLEYAGSIRHLLVGEGSPDFVGSFNLSFHPFVPEQPNE